MTTQLVLMRPTNEVKDKTLQKAVLLNKVLIISVYWPRTVVTRARFEGLCMQIIYLYVCILSGNSGVILYAMHLIHWKM